MTSQKFPGFIVVPWSNRDEWKRVYSSIFDENTSKLKQQEALDLILIWQQRTPLLPSGIEGTLCILEAMLTDEESLSERQCSSFYSSSIMRFLNICVANRAQLSTFTKTVISNSIPDWIVNIRHDFAHSQKLPSIAILKLAVNECFKWLKTTYWDPEMSTITNYNIQAVEHSQLPRKVFDVYCNLLIYLIINQDFSYEKRISIQDAVEFDLSSLNRFEIMKTLLNSIESNAQDLNDEDWEYIVSQFCDCLIDTPKAIFDMKDNTTNTYQFLENTIIFLNRNGQIINFIVHLMRIVNCEETSFENKMQASLWLNEVFKGFLKAKLGNDKTEYDTIEGIGINFKEFSAENIEDMKRIIYVILEKFNEFTTNYIDSYYLLINSNKLVDAKAFFQQIQQANIHNIKILSEIDDCGCLSEQIPYPNMELYSLINEVEMAANYNKNILDNNIDKTPTKRKRWSIVEDTKDYERCAIGVLPF